MKTLTSEAVSPGHPDKIADQVSDAILDEYLRSDSAARVAVETLATAHGLVLAGEVNSGAWVDHEHVARGVVRGIGYTRENGYGPDDIEVRDHVVPQSTEIHSAVDAPGALGAGDQGMMFGYATKETPELMPLPVTLARALIRRLVDLRETQTLPWLLPDAKVQVSVGYARDVPAELQAVVISSQHASEVDLGIVRTALAREVLGEVMGSREWGIRYSPNEARLHLNPAGSWSVGGPASDAGLTGRKIIADTYGGASRHGGGAFSGKDPSKVDRSAAYAARQAAKYLVAHGAAERAEIQLSYAIGVVEPVSLRVDTFGTGADSDEALAELVMRRFTFTPQGIIDRLDLTTPRYLDTAARGHFGRANLPWEQVR